MENRRSTLSSNAGWVAGKTCVITGANSGIGKAASLALARMGAKVVMVSRDEARGEAARSEVLRSSGAKKEDVRLALCDLASFESVRSLASGLLQTESAIHVLVNNAGLTLGSRTLTKDGLETTFEVNYLSHFLLTLLLLDRLKSSAPSRIINVSSSAHESGHMDFDDLQGAGHYGGMRAYSQSKLAQVLFTAELARRLKGTGVTANAVHPGAVATNWATKSSGALSIGVRLAHPFMLSPEKGADTVVYLASSEDVAQISGEYFTKRHAIAPAKEATDSAVAERLWKVSLELTGFAKDPTSS